MGTQKNRLIKTQSTCLLKKSLLIWAYDYGQENPCLDQSSIPFDQIKILCVLIFMVLRSRLSYIEKGLIWTAVADILV